MSLAAMRPGFFPALFESQSQNEKIGRVDLLFAAPALELVAFDHDQLQQLLELVDRPLNEPSKAAHFEAGWLLYFSYEAAYYLESKLSQLAPKHNSQPLAVAVYCRGAVVWDHYAEQGVIHAEDALVMAQIEQHLADCQAMPISNMMLGNSSEADGEAFKQAVRDAKAWIQSGDIYQANLSRQYQVTCAEEVRAVDIYAQLKAANPAPFAGLIQLPSFAVISSSPERLFRVGNGVIETRPIAGTRPRGQDAQADAQLMEELIQTPKERAEHIMLIDLERNDVGKVCQIGTVEVDELMVIETYEHVHHIVSNVKGSLRQDVTFVEVLKALFPGGTITGCPKIRCMEIIHDLEQRDRGCYTGSMGYINHDGLMDFNILIRTMGLCQQTLSFSAGAGIVFDSDPTAELIETRHKAKGMLRALGTSPAELYGSEA